MSACWAMKMFSCKKKVLFSFTKTCNPPLYMLKFLYRESSDSPFLSPFGTKCIYNYIPANKVWGVYRNQSVHHILSALLLLNCLVEFNQTLHKGST